MGEAGSGKGAGGSTASRMATAHSLATTAASTLPRLVLRGNQLDVGDEVRGRRRERATARDVDDDDASDSETMLKMMPRGRGPRRDAREREREDAAGGRRRRRAGRGDARQLAVREVARSTTRADE